jgi:hypothetical protein
MSARCVATAYLEFSTPPPASPGGFYAWAAYRAERSLRFLAEIERLRRLAAGADRGGYPRTTGPLTTWSLEELERELKTAQQVEQADRRRAWKNTALLTDDPLRHVRDYLRGCRRVARTYLGSEQLAPEIHALVRRGGYLASAPATDRPAPTRANASQLAAHISGASWGAGATANAQAWRRARPQQPRPRPDTFVL